MQVVPFGAQHVDDAARLVTERFRALRQAVPSMPTRLEDVGSLVERLGAALPRMPGCAAVDGPRLVGFLCGLDIAYFRGRHTKISPEWAHGAAYEGSRRIHEALYGALSGTWAAEGASAHLVIALAHDEQALQAWRWLGFGMLAVDGLRDLSLVGRGSSDGENRRATLADVDVVTALGVALQHHLQAPPTFLAQADPPSRQAHVAWLEDQRNALWLALSGDEAVAYVRQGPANENASEIIADPGTTSITGAYARPEFRGRGIASALLNRALAWGKEQGYVRCAVDYEPMNTPAARFWGRHFAPVSYGFIRYLDETLIGRESAGDDSTC